MSNIGSMRTDIMAKITAAVAGTVTVGRWAGEDAAMASTKPGVYVQWTGATTGDNDEIGAITYVENTEWIVFVATEDLTGSYGDDQAATILEQIRVALAGKEIASIGWAEPLSGEFSAGKTESLIAIHGGSYLYAQAWRVEQVESNV